MLDPISQLEGLPLFRGILSLPGGSPELAV